MTYAYQEAKDPEPKRPRQTAKPSTLLAGTSVLVERPTLLNITIIKRRPYMARNLDRFEHVAPVKADLIQLFYTFLYYILK